MKKGIIIGAVILIAIGIIGFMALAPTSLDDAILYVEHGVVEVNAGNGWKAANNEMLITQGSQVRTKEGEAIIVLLEGEVIKLLPNTEFTITTVNNKEIKLDQSAGQTWHKVTKLSGISDYTTTTPNTVATVRGTEYFLNDQVTGVTEGNVDYKNKDNNEQVNVPTGQKATYPTLELQDLTAEELEAARQFRLQYIDTLKKIRMREIRKHTILINLAKSKGYTEEKMLAELDKIDRGETDLEEVRQKVPSAFKNKTKRAFELTRVIRDSIAKS